mmetsp:Transcript_35657/g.89922  ORF Transcript_35657/g.89922 Transcript_35657/m.89922 type:complete len:217 (-) Transcript_35657:62-712(-)
MYLPSSSARPSSVKAGSPSVPLFVLRAAGSTTSRIGWTKRLGAPMIRAMSRANIAATASGGSQAIHSAALTSCENTYASRQDGCFQPSVCFSSHANASADSASTLDPDSSLISEAAAIASYTLQIRQLVAFPLLSPRLAKSAAAPLPNACQTSSRCDRSVCGSPSLIPAAIPLLKGAVAVLCGANRYKWKLPPAAAHWALVELSRRLTRFWMPSYG